MAIPKYRRCIWNVTRKQYSAFKPICRWPDSIMMSHKIPPHVFIKVDETNSEVCKVCKAFCDEKDG